MKGFDPKYRDPPDFILGITKEIWEDRGIKTLEHRYTEDIPVRSPSSVVVGNKAVIAATMATLAEFPDRQLLGEDVIWSGSADEPEGFLSSHRLLTTATHQRDGIYGPATGTKLTYRVIADCACRDDQVYDEWLIRDQGAIVRQIGLEPKRYAADRIAAEGGPERCARPFTPDSDIAGPYTGRGNEQAVAGRYAELLTRMMAGDLAAVPQTYDRAAQFDLPGGTTGHGWEAADRFWLGLRSSFPDAAFEIHHRIGREDPGQPPRAALRWSLWGRHDGTGAFGDPTGAQVYVMGISHAEFGPWGLKREFVLIDETAIWKQILIQSG